MTNIIKRPHLKQTPLGGGAGRSFSRRPENTCTPSYCGRYCEYGPESRRLHTRRRTNVTETMKRFFAALLYGIAVLLTFGGFLIIENRLNPQSGAYTDGAYDKEV